MMNFRSIAKLCSPVSGNDFDIPGNQLAGFVGQIKGVCFVLSSLAIQSCKRANLYKGIS